MYRILGSSDNGCTGFFLAHPAGAFTIYKYQVEPARIVRDDDGRLVEIVPPVFEVGGWVTGDLVGMDTLNTREDVGFSALIQDF